MATTTASSQQIVLRNALTLVIAQALTIPLSMATNAMMGRFMGPEDFGHLYLATTTASCTFLFVDWGTSSTLPARIAREPSRAGELFGTATAWRVVSAILMGSLVVAGSFVLGSPVNMRFALALVVVTSAVTSLSGVCQDLARGYERTDVTAYASVGGQLLTAAFVVPTLFLGGKLRSALAAQLLASAIVLSLLWRTVRRSSVGPLSFHAPTLKALLREGAPFLFFGVAMVVQPYVDAAFLSALAPGEALGWFAAAKRLVGVLVFPAGALIGALYPTLCRLHAHDEEGYRRTVRSGLSSATMLVVPAAAGCALYPDIGIRIYGRSGFQQAEADLRALALFVFLVYFSMVLGVALLAAGKARAWAFVQFLCVAVSLIADPLLVPWFQERMGNGGLGVCVANVGSEVLMVVGGIWLVPRGVFDRSLVRGLSSALFAGGVMAGVAILLSGLPALAAAPIAVVAYVACLWITGGLTADQVEAVRTLMARKFSRKTV
ncbi:MAG TPA: oligosaccharide flippase family protein [Polyangiaceae bacterium]|nr:oligosaccharide flippase family protein [Polyangiaceae bacterium]